MNNASIFIVDIFGEIADAMNDVFVQKGINLNVNYTYGRSIQILKSLQDLNNSITLKDKKYPLLALFQDFPEKFDGSGYQCTVTFPKIVIATLTTSTDAPPKRYEKTFKPILYPVYEEFKNQIARHRQTVINDPTIIPHIKFDRPGTQPEGSNLNEYIDAIEIQNLTLTFSLINSCKKI